MTSFKGINRHLGYYVTVKHIKFCFYVNVDFVKSKVISFDNLAMNRIKN